MLKYYVCWLLLMSAVTFFLMGWDKHLARSRRRRIPERVLLGWRRPAARSAAYSPCSCSATKRSTAIFPSECP